MNNQATIEKMMEMRLHGMMRAFRETFETGIKDNFNSDEIIAHLVDAEWDERYNKKLDNLLKKARFRYKASCEQIDFKSSRKINKNNFLRFTTCDWVKKRESILITGATGVGKSFVACALGHQACLSRYKVIYFNCMKLFSSLKYAKADGSYPKEISKIKKQDLIILDDFGLKKLDSDSRLILLEILEDRHGEKSTIITSQLPIKNWFEVIGDPTIADAICDRLIHSSHKIDIKGESMRKVKEKNSGRNLPPKS